jgi:HSP20 family protein
MPPSFRRVSSDPSKANGPESPKGIAGIEGILTGLSGLLAQLGNLAEKGAELQKTGTFQTQTGKDVNFHYGVSVRTANGGSEVKVEPFGNLKRDQSTGESVVAEVREPLADIFEENDHVLAVLEMPGIVKDDVKLDAQGDVLCVTAERSGKRYRKELLLPISPKVEAITVTCNNGVVEIRCPK